MSQYTLYCKGIQCTVREEWTCCRQQHFTFSVVVFFTHGSSIIPLCWDTLSLTYQVLISFDLLMVLKLHSHQDNKLVQSYCFQTCSVHNTSLLTLFLHLLHNAEIFLYTSALSIYVLMYTVGVHVDSRWKFTVHTMSRSEHTVTWKSTVDRVLFSQNRPCQSLA